MASKIIQTIRQAFGQNDYPGDQFLQGSFDGSEPAEAVEPFKGRTDWQALEPELLDRQYSALHFFSQAGLRFFLPAYLMADLRGELQTADPLFVLIHGFQQVVVRHRTARGTFERKTGKGVFVNPRRYGAVTFDAYARWRLSVFGREEATAIVAYLRYKQQTAATPQERAGVEAALQEFWLARAESAPTAAELKQHLADEAAYLAAVAAEMDGQGS
jgi:hypothetical protein